MTFLLLLPWIAISFSIISIILVLLHIFLDIDLSPIPLIIAVIGFTCAIINLIIKITI